MKRHALLGAVALLIVLPLGAEAAGISSLTDDPQQYNGSSVTVRGSVGSFHETRAGQGGSYATFSVCGGGCVRVYVPGNPQLTDGESVTVTGTFASVDHLNGNVYYNQIDSDVLSVQRNNPLSPNR